MAGWEANALSTKARDDLTRTLFASPGPIVYGSLVMCGAAVMAAHRTADLGLWTGAGVLAAISAIRLAVLMAFVAVPSYVPMAAWRRLYAYGVTASSAALGGIVMLCLLRHADPVSHMILVSTAVGYGSGVAGRNAGCLAASLPQLWVLLFPTAMGLAIHGDASYAGLAVAVLVFSLGMTTIAISVNRSLVGAYVLADEQELMGRHDAVTGLLNRGAMDRALVEALADGAPASLLAIDLDRFKAVNDSHGHGVGDALLRAVADRVRGLVPEGAIAARLGGDEFLVLSPGPESEASSDRLAAAIVRALDAPFVVDGREISVSASVGVASCPRDGLSAPVLMRAADTALYRVKADGRCGWRSFDPAMDAEAQERRAMEADLRQAISDGGLDVVYQPQLDLATRAYTTCEALVRWTHPTRGSVSPAEFIPLAEETGLIHRIGVLVLERACRDALAWPDATRVAVNLSPVQFRHDLPRAVGEALRRSGLPAHRLELEVTESVFLENKEEVRAAFRSLGAMGVGLSLDDFGTGYSSLSYLRSFPFGKVKIDRSFVAGIEAGVESLAVIRAVSGLGRDLGMQVVVEGVETEAQLRAIDGLGCTAAQGYLVGRPGGAAETGALLSRLSAPVAAAA